VRPASEDAVARATGGPLEDALAGRPRVRATSVLGRKLASQDFYKGQPPQLLNVPLAGGLWHSIHSIEDEIQGSRGYCGQRIGSIARLCKEAD